MNGKGGSGVQKLRYAVEDIILLVALCLVIGLAQGRADDKPQQATGERALKPAPVAFESVFAYCDYGTRKVPCGKLFIKYDDGSESHRTISMSLENSWEQVGKDLGKAMDEMQRDFNRIMRERGKEPK